MNYCEPWIERKLRERLMAYKKRYPLFKVDRVMEQVSHWEPKAQRYAPYMSDAALRNLNKSYHWLQSIRSLAMNEHL